MENTTLHNILSLSKERMKCMIDACVSSNDFKVLGRVAIALSHIHCFVSLLKCIKTGKKISVLSHFTTQLKCACRNSY